MERLRPDAGPRKLAALLSLTVASMVYPSRAQSALRGWRKAKCPDSPMAYRNAVLLIFVVGVAFCGRFEQRWLESSTR